MLFFREYHYYVSVCAVAVCSCVQLLFARTCRYCFCVCRVPLLCPCVPRAVAVCSCVLVLCPRVPLLFAFARTYRCCVRVCRCCLLARAVAVPVCAACRCCLLARVIAVSVRAACRYCLFARGELNHAADLSLAAPRRPRRPSRLRLRRSWLCRRRPSLLLPRPLLRRPSRLRLRRY